MEPNKVKKLPLYKLKINPEEDDLSGVTIISLVNEPAIERNFQMFSTNTKQKNQRFAVQNEEMQIVTGAIMVADLPIYRKDEQTGEEYFVVADKDSIYQIVQKFFKTNRTSSVDTQHNGMLVNGVYMIESFIIDSNRGINPPTGYGELPDGSWFGSFKIESPQIWQEIKAGTFKGFSIAGLFDYAKVSMKKQKSDLQLFYELKEILQSI
jgi:Putative phage serine protease XkdF